MGSGDEAKMLRSIAGDVAEQIKDITGMDLRCIVDPTPLFRLQDLRDTAKDMKLDGSLEPEFKKIESRIRANQYMKWQEKLETDLSILGTGSGNKDDSWEMGDLLDDE